MLVLITKPTGRAMSQGSRPFDRVRDVLLFALAALGLVLLAYALLGAPGVGGAFVAVAVRVAYLVRVRRSSAR